MKTRWTNGKPRIMEKIFEPSALRNFFEQMLLCCCILHFLINLPCILTSADCWPHGRSFVMVFNVISPSCNEEITRNDVKILYKKRKNEFLEKLKKNLKN